MFMMIDKKADLLGWWEKKQNDPGKIKFGPKLSAELSYNGV